MVLCVMVLCSQRLCAQEMLLGVEEMFRLADRNSVSIKAYGTGREAADEALKAAKSQPSLLSGTILLWRPARSYMQEGRSTAGSNWRR